ncbi:MAG: MOSC domain-containing protein [Candidatus Gracilibacteria bacterium]
MIQVMHLFLKPTHGKPMMHADTLHVKDDGQIVGNVECSTLRQILILPSETIHDFSLQPGDLKENIIIEGYDIHSLPSGTVLQIGDVKVRLTIHCEPCYVIKDKVNIGSIMHRRGVLGTLLNEGSIQIGDEVQIGGAEFEPIPYDIPERIRWFLSTYQGDIYSTDLMKEIGLSASYCRALPNYMRKLSEEEKAKIKYKKSFRKEI